MQWHVMMFQRAKPKYTSCHLSLFNVNNRNEVGGFVGCQEYVCVHLAVRRTIIWVVRVTSSKSSTSSYPTYMYMELMISLQHLPNCTRYLLLFVRLRRRELIFRNLPSNKMRYSMIIHSREIISLIILT